MDGEGKKETVSYRERKRNFRDKIPIVETKSTYTASQCKHISHNTAQWKNIFVGLATCNGHIHTYLSDGL